MNQLDIDYQNLLKDILENGVEKNTRNGKVLSVFGRTIRHSFKDGKFPLLTTKKMYWKGIVTELLWFLRGDTNIKFLVDNGCHIWDGDAYKNYVKKEERPLKAPENFINKIKTDDEFAKKWGELGPIYGKQWRSWNAYQNYDVTRYQVKQIDQIANLINELKTNPDSRRLMVSAWNVGELDQMVLPPCHYGFQVYTRELSTQERVDIYYKSNYAKDTFPTNNNGWNNLCDGFNIPKRAISLMYNTRSQDVPLGTPFNIASYALLLEIIAKMVNMVPDELITNMGDCHIYLNQINGIEEQLKRESFDLPTLRINTEFWPTKSGECGVGELTDNIDFLIKEMRIDDFQIENYKSHPPIKMPLSN